ncbi:MAG: NAD(P)H:quinone oxidoreductase [Paracoccaceae bacterium]
MNNVKLAIVFYSTYGTNHAVAETAAKAARTKGAEVRLVRIAETAPENVVKGQEAWARQLDKMQDIPVATLDDMEWANAYLFVAPTRFGSMPSQLRAFIDTLGGLWSQGKLANKAVSAMTSAQNLHGGQESTLLGLYTTLMHWGTIIVTPGYTDSAVAEAGGNPYGFSTQPGALDDEAKAAIAHQTGRLIEVAAKLAGTEAKSAKEAA